MSERYPTFRAGQKVTGALLASIQPLSVRKTSDTSRATDTASADTELQFTPEANAVYLFEGVLIASSTLEPDDINIGWGIPAGADGSWGAIGPVQDATTLNTTVRIVGGPLSTSRNFGTDNGGAGNPAQISVNGNLIMGSAATAFSLSWARGTGGAGTTTLYQDSWLKFTRIA